LVTASIVNITSFASCANTGNIVESLAIRVNGLTITIRIEVASRVAG
jgi:hypothetical protein